MMGKLFIRVCVKGKKTTLIYCILCFSYHKNVVNTCYMYENYFEIRNVKIWNKASSLLSPPPPSPQYIHVIPTTLFDLLLLLAYVNNLNVAAGLLQLFWYWFAWENVHEIRQMNTDLHKKCSWAIPAKLIASCKVFEAILVLVFSRFHRHSLFVSNSF